MPWVRLDDGFTHHPKALAVGPLGIALQVGALCHCARNLTDGFVAADALPLLVPGMNGQGEAVAAKLVEAGIWLTAPGGWQIHDYLVYQPPKSEVLALRVARSEAGRRGGKASGEARKQTAKQKVKQPRSKDPSKREAESNPVPVPVPVPKTQTALRAAETENVSARDITAAYVDAFRATHNGADPLDPKGMAGLVKKALLARHPPDSVMRAAVSVGRSGAGARGFQRVLVEEPVKTTQASEPKSWATIREAKP